MKANELGSILKSMYEKAPRGQKVTQIHLFGIEYGKQIRENKISVPDIITSSGLHESYKTEITKGIKLSNFVTIKGK